MILQFVGACGIEFWPWFFLYIYVRVCTHTNFCIDYNNPQIKYTRYVEMNI